MLSRLAKKAIFKTARKAVRKHKVKSELQQAQLIKITNQEMKKNIFSLKVLKKSKHLGKWRQRILSLTPNYIFTFTFTIEEQPQRVTETIGLDQIEIIEEVQHKQIKDNNSTYCYFYKIVVIDEKDKEIQFQFACKTKQERSKQIQLILQNVKKVNQKSQLNLKGK